MSWINQWIKNRLNQKCGNRIACYLEDNGLTCYINCRNKFIYKDGKVTKYITDPEFDFDEIDLFSLQKIVEQLQQPAEKSHTQQTKEKYGISKKYLKEADLTLIAKYEENMRSKR